MVFGGTTVGGDGGVAMVDDDDATRGRRPLREMVEEEFLRDLVRARDGFGTSGVEGRYRRRRRIARIRRAADGARENGWVMRDGDD